MVLKYMVKKKQILNQIKAKMDNYIESYISPRVLYSNDVDRKSLWTRFYEFYYFHFAHLWRKLSLIGTNVVHSKRAFGMSHYYIHCFELLTN